MSNKPGSISYASVVVSNAQWANILNNYRLYDVNLVVCLVKSDWYIEFTFLCQKADMALVIKVFLLM